MKKIVLTVLLLCMVLPVFAKRNEGKVENTPEEIESMIKQFLKEGDCIIVFKEEKDGSVRESKWIFPKSSFKNILFGGEGKGANSVSISFSDINRQYKLDDYVLRLDENSNLLIVD